MANVHSYEDCVATLPIHPRIETSIGFYCTPVIGDIFAKLTKRHFVSAINVIGRRSLDVNSVVHGYLNNLRKLHVEPVFIWRDDSQKHSGEIVNYLNELIQKGLVVQEKREIKICECGAVEMLAHEFERVGRLKVLNIISRDVYFCRLCGSKPQSVERESLLLRTPRKIAPKVYPQCLQSEFDHQLSKICSHEQLISRTRPDNSSVQIDGKGYTLDVDFVWATYIRSMFDAGYKIKTVVCSNHVLARLAMVFATNSPLLEERSLFSEVVVTPYYQVDLKQNIIEQYDHTSVRALLLSMYHVRHKKVGLNSRDLYLFQKSFSTSVRLSSDLVNAMDTQQTLELMDGHNVSKMAQMVRKYDQLDWKYSDLYKAICI